MLKEYTTALLYLDSPFSLMLCIYTVYIFHFCTCTINRLTSKLAEIRQFGGVWIYVFLLAKHRDHSCKRRDIRLTATERLVKWGVLPLNVLMLGRGGPTAEGPEVRVMDGWRSRRNTRYPKLTGNTSGTTGKCKEIRAPSLTNGEPPVKCQIYIS